MWPLGAWLLKGTLQEAAVAALDFGKRVAKHQLKAGRAVDDGVVVARGVRDEECAAKVDWADADRGVGAQGESCLHKWMYEDAANIKAARRVRRVQGSVHGREFIRHEH